MKRIIFIIFVLFLYSCGDASLYETHIIFEEKDIDLEHLEEQLINRFNKTPYNIHQINVSTNEMKIQSFLPNDNIETLNSYNEIFSKSNIKILIAKNVKSIDNTDNLKEIQGFQPYFDYEKGYLPKDVLGTSENLDSAMSIQKTIAQIVPNISTFWSSTNHNSNEVYYLHVSEKVEKLELTPSSIIQVFEGTFEYGYEVNMAFDQAGSKKLSEMTQNAISSGNNTILLIINNLVFSNPRILEPITTGRLTFDGNLTREENNKLVKKLKLGNLDYNLQIIQQDKVEQQ